MNFPIQKSHFNSGSLHLLAQKYSDLLFLASAGREEISVMKIRDECVLTDLLRGCGRVFDIGILDRSICK